MLSRFISKPSRHLSLLSRNLSSHLHCPASHAQPSISPLLSTPDYPISIPSFNFRPFSTRNDDNGNSNSNSNKRPPNTNFWSLFSENDDSNAFGKEEGDLKGIVGGDEVEREVKGATVEPSWAAESGSDERDGFEGLRDEFEGNNDSGGGVGDEWAAAAANEFKPWKLEEEEKVEDLFNLDGITAAREEAAGDKREKSEAEGEYKIVDVEKLKEEEEHLKVVLKGPNRAFGDLIAASGITDAMLDSLMALKNFEDVEGLPPLAEIEDMRYEKTTRKSSRYEMERLKQEEAAKARVRVVDEKGRAYGTGKRKCSIARVWIQPGEGKFSVNDKEFDVYFPMLDHRAAILRPFSETKTLGLWDIKCTVKGGGVSGQVGAVRLGISRALQNWEPGLRPQLREAGFLTRDPRVVERKKPGKAKARKSFQWVKR